MALAFSGAYRPRILQRSDMHQAIWLKNAGLPAAVSVGDSLRFNSFGVLFAPPAPLAALRDFPGSFGLLLQGVDARQLTGFVRCGLSLFRAARACACWPAFGNRLS